MKDALITDWLRQVEPVFAAGPEAEPFGLRDSEMLNKQISPAKNPAWFTLHNSLPVCGYPFAILSGQSASRKKSRHRVDARGDLFLVEGGEAEEKPWDLCVDAVARECGHIEPLLTKAVA